jgi:hypothetical protein
LSNLLNLGQYFATVSEATETIASEIIICGFEGGGNQPIVHVEVPENLASVLVSTIGGSFVLPDGLAEWFELNQAAVFIPEKECSLVQVEHRIKKCRILVKTPEQTLYRKI